jgi:hypothetical protein
MEGLLRRLPPLAPDYSGASGVFFTLGGIIMLNGADGCVGNVTGYDEPRFFDHSPFIYSTGLREMQAITGDEEVLKKKIDLVLGEKDIPFIVILGTPNSAVIASDHAGVASIVRRDRKVPVFPMNTTGMLTYEQGASAAFLELAKTFPKTSGQGGGVHILGASPLDYWGERQVDNMIQALEEEGVQVTGVWGMDGSLETIEAGAEADAILVVSFAGLAAARYMRRRWGIPFTSGVPVGREQTLRLVGLLCGETKEHNFGPVSNNGSGEKALIIGDQIWASSIREYLMLEGRFSQVATASLFSLDKEYKTEDDFQAGSEEELDSLIRNFRPNLVIGDPLFKTFCPEAAMDFVEVPHLAVSSRIYWDHDAVYTGLNLSF